MRIPLTKLKVFVFFIFSAVFAFLLTLLPNELFRDRANYIIYAKDSLNIMERYDGIALFTNEPLFLLLNSALSFFFEPDVVPLFFVFFIAFTISFFIFFRSKNIFLVLLGFFALALVPQSFHMLLIVLRQAFAASLLMWFVFYFWKSKLFFPLVFCLGFIHSSTFIVLFFLILDKLFSITVTKNIFLRVSFIIFVSAFISFMILPIAEVLALRQASEYDEATSGGGGGNFILYLIVLFISLTQSKQKFTDDGLYIIAMLGVSIYLGMYFLSPFAGRLITTFMPFIICLMCSFGNKRALLLLSFFVLINSFIFKQAIESNSLTEQGIIYLLGG
ncbi:EpsG family protein [Shewanella sp. ISTPL2]|uniref:EpsG family protein n=1 Tax=Shewanella sp. ISTPL2 TaxID=2699425 RepID=UPI001569F1B6|nr:EpsG family protein [Shewanella sp. ISTPL2]